jgi:ESX secretion system protein EccE
VDTPNAAALARQQATDQSTAGTTAAPTRAAPPLRIAASAARATAAARPLPQQLPEVDVQTRPLLLTPPVRPAGTTPVAPVSTAPPRLPWSRHLREYTARLSAIQVLCWQVAAIGVLLTVRQPWPVLAGCTS